MPENDRIFLSTGEALEAVRAAFTQYPSQVNLISVIWPLVFGHESYVMQDSNRRTIWVKTSKRSKLIAASEDDLKQRIVRRLKQSPPPLQQLASICSQVFGTRTCASSTPTLKTTAGIWIDTDMADFKCIQCGHCCQTLNYHDACSIDDYQRWQALGRTDILEWVGTICEEGEVIACRIWMEPGTNRYADTCPWLKQVDQSGRTRCTIYDVRPSVCRHYPGTRKHARMTGCLGV